MPPLSVGYHRLTFHCGMNLYSADVAYSPLRDENYRHRDVADGRLLRADEYGPSFLGLQLSSDVHSRSIAPTGGESHDSSWRNSPDASMVRLLSPTTSTRDLLRDDDSTLLTPCEKQNNRTPVKRRFPTGWSTGAIASLVCTVSVFVFNLVITIWAWVSYDSTSNDDAVGTIYSGTCTRVKSMNVWIHLLANVGPRFAL